MKLLLLLVYHKFQSTLPTRGSDLVFCAKFQLDKLISIHAPHEGERLNPAAGWLRRHAISIHAPHEGERRAADQTAIQNNIFQSTLPTRGSDQDGHAAAVDKDHISIHAPHEGERRAASLIVLTPLEYFNPRSPRGGATGRKAFERITGEFQSTLPTRGSDVIGSRAICVANSISIHAPHEGERPSFLLFTSAVAVFQSTLPTRGSDMAAGKSPQEIRHFNPRSPRGGATFLLSFYFIISHISIHAPHEGERRNFAIKTSMYKYFNPRSPRGGATTTRSASGGCLGISIHAPHEGERQSNSYSGCNSVINFNPRSPRGGATPKSIR